MALLYDATTNALAAVGATSKALAATLFDSRGNPVVRDSAYVGQPNIYSFYASTAPMAANGLGGVWIVNGPRRCRLRQIGVHGTQASAAAASQASIAIARAYFGAPVVSTSTPGFLSPANYRAAVKRSSLSKSPSAVIVDNGTSLILTTAIEDQSIFYQWAIPNRTVSHLESFVDFTEEGDDSGFLFDANEGLTFTLAGSISNSIQVSVDWDEYEVV
jgi:hypothetical protein